MPLIMPLLHPSHLTTVTDELRYDLWTHVKGVTPIPKKTPGLPTKIVGLTVHVEPVLASIGIDMLMKTRTPLGDIALDTYEVTLEESGSGTITYRYTSRCSMSRAVGVLLVDSPRLGCLKAV